MLDVRVVRQYQKNYPQLLKSINKLFLHKAGAIVVGDAQRFAPSGNAHLSGSIKAKVQLLNDRVIVGTNVEYAPYVEYGTGIYAEGGKGRKTPWSYKSEKYGWVTTKGMVKQSFLRRSLDWNRQNLVKEWRSLFRKTFRTMGLL